MATTGATSYDDTCVVVPVFNEASVVGAVVTELRQHFSHVVCVDDGSSDGSADLAEAAGACVIRHPGNLGQGAALQTGIEYALARRPLFRHLVTFDADGQHRTMDARRMVEQARHTGTDVVLGSRFLRRTTTTPPARRALLRLATLFTRLTTGLPFTDTHNGLRVLNRRAAQAARIRLSGMAHASEILGVVARCELTYLEVPVEVLYTEYSRRKGQSALNSVNILVDLMTARLRPAR